MNIAVIPARGGSRRLPRKNIRPFCGQPMIGWSIAAARQSGLFDDVIVSTDCDQIASVARSLGASVPFRRPAEIADDMTPTIPVIRHTLDWLREQGRQVELVCCLYATAPFVRVQDMQDGYRRLRDEPQLDFAFPVTSFGFPIFRSLKIEEDRVTMMWPEHETTRSQDLPEAWHDAGQFYWGTPRAFHRYDGFYSACSAPIVIPRHRVQDIDTPEDWQRAELMFRILQANNEAEAA